MLTEKEETKLGTLVELSEAIEKMVGDDETLVKIGLNFIHKLNTHLDSHEEISESIFDPNKIAEQCWPYARDPPSLEALSVPRTVFQTKELRKGNSSNFEADILSIIQRSIGKKVKMSDLRKISSIISKKISVPLKKRSTQSKKRIIEWLCVNWEKAEPHLNESVMLIQEN